MLKANTHFRPDHAASRGVLLLSVCVCALWCGGCVTKKRPTFHYAAVALAHPVVPVAAVANLPPEPPPDIPLELVSPAGLAWPRRAVPRPHAVSQAPPETATEEKEADPLIAPELSPAQLAAARSDTLRSLEATSANLARVQGKSLNPAQNDLTSKIRGFMDSAHEAMQSGDWQRAENLAKKAEVLSQELIAAP